MSRKIWKFWTDQFDTKFENSNQFEKFESFERINSIRDANESFDSCNSWKRLGTSRFTWVASVKTFVCISYRIYPFKTLELFCVRNFCSCTRGLSYRAEAWVTATVTADRPVGFRQPDLDDHVAYLSQCQWMSPSNWDWIYLAPTLLVLSFNFVFLIRIMWVSTSVGRRCWC